MIQKQNQYKTTQEILFMQWGRKMQTKQEIKLQNEPKCPSKQHKHTGANKWISQPTINVFPNDALAILTWIILITKGHLKNQEDNIYETYI